MTRAELAAAGYDVDEPAHAQLDRFVALLLEENRRLNLTSIRDARQAWVTHVCDSLALVPLVRAGCVDGLLDLGSGGGVPGVPLACVCSDLHVTLVDSTRKKLAAVERIVTELGLANVEYAVGRAETLAHQPACRERFDAVTARAVAELRVLLEYAAGFVRPGGWCWFFKTRAACAGEVQAAQRAAQTCALEFVEARPYALPERGGRRVIVVYRKRDPLRADLPRSAGRPSKRPW